MDQFCGFVWMWPGTWWEMLSGPGREGVATFTGALFGAVVTVLGAAWLAKWQLRVERNEQQERQREALAMTLTPVITYLNVKIPSTISILDEIGDQPTIPSATFQKLKEPVFSTLRNYLDHFQLLPIAVRYDAMQLAAWGELYNTLIDDCTTADDAATRQTRIEFTRVVGDLNGPKKLLQKILILQKTLLDELGPIHEDAVARGNAAQSTR